MMLRSRLGCERFATRNTLFYLRRPELSTGTSVIFGAGATWAQQVLPHFASLPMPHGAGAAFPQNHTIP